MENNNCLKCDYSYTKDLFMDNTENVIICSCDDSYIGYPEEIEKETCKFKTVICLKSDFNCIGHCILNGKLFATEFATSFIKDKKYKLLSSKNDEYILFNEQKEIEKYGKEFNNYFEILNT